MTNNLSPSMQQQATSKIDAMEWLFGQLYGMYGKAFTDKFGSGAIVNGKDTGIENTKSVWRESIRANDLRMPDIKVGLAACGKFVPTWPEFLELCRPTPDIDAAIVEAVAQLQARRDGKDVWSHPAIYWAAMKVGYHEMTNMSHAQLRPRFSAALDAVMSEEPKPIPTITVAPRIAMAPVTEADIAKAKAVISNYAHEVVKRNGEPIDGLHWAKRIIDRNARGDKSVSLYQLREAQQAIENGCEP